MLVRELGSTLMGALLILLVAGCVRLPAEKGAPDAALRDTGCAGGVCPIDADGDGSFSIESDGDDCDDVDASVYPGAVEVAYDGIDQDCDGADLLDLDGDGVEAAVAGGTDCDDTDAAVYPGATETPYDGLDQDCDGTDLVDVDGDGFIATDAGGDDCDDEDASVYPGAIEIEADGTDNDCDHRLDEVAVCWDGSGAYLTIQEGVHAAPDGGVVEVCAGIYVETLVILDREITIEGVGETPDDVVLEAPAGAGVINASGSSTNLTLRRLFILDDGDWDVGDIETIGGEEIGELRLESVRTRATAPGGAAVIQLVCDAGDCNFDASLCWIEDTLVQVVTNGGLLSIERSVLVDVQLSADPEDEEAYRAASLSVSNVLSVNGHLVVSTSGDDRSSVALEHLTVIGDPSTTLGLLYVACGHVVYEGWGDVDFCPSTSVARAILSLGGVWRGIGTGDRLVANPSSAYPRLEEVLAHEMGDPLGIHRFYTADGDDGVEDSEVVSAYIEASMSWGDPLFAPGEMGSYSLDATSPAVDASGGAGDADGSLADLGAFGGPDSDWWRDFEWPLP